MIAHAVVRGIRADMSSLKSAIQYEGYLPEKGSFVVFFYNYKREETLLKPIIQSSWSPLWHEVDIEFEKEVSTKPEFKFLSGKMFYVWEGNHHLIAWMELISQMYKQNRTPHNRVFCSVIDPRQTFAISLLTGLQRVNTMNLSALLQDRVKMLESLRIKDTSIKGKQQWYPLTRVHLARLLFQVEYILNLKKAEDLVLSTISSENRDETLKKECAKIHKKLADKMGMVFNILDSKLCDQWLDRIFALKFDSHDFVITIVKLNFLANYEMSEEKRLVLLYLFDSNKRLKDMYEKVEIEAIQSLEDSKKACVLGTPLDQDYLLQDYFLEGVKLEARKYLFAQVRARVQAMDARATNKVEGPQQRKRNKVIMAAYRVVFRYLCHLVWEKKLTRLSDHCKGWIDRGNEEVCMYPSSMQVFVVEQEKVDSSPPKDQVNQTSIFQGDQRVALKEVFPFVFLPCPMNDTLFGKYDVISYGFKVGDYLSMGRDFVTKKRNDAYKTLHDFFTKHVRDGSTYTRNRKSVKWACDMVFIDFPIGCFVDKESTLPTWNVLIEAHICLGITIVAASMGDNGCYITADQAWIPSRITIKSLVLLKTRRRKRRQRNDFVEAFKGQVKEFKLGEELEEKGLLGIEELGEREEHEEKLEEIGLLEIEKL
ncbi:hypothetical protein L7F22_045304 [Adiantum nelumboides]|nr:hypothetical protein [Adiantum nelumboides]